MLRSVLPLALLLAGCGANFQPSPLATAARVGDVNAIQALIRAGAGPDQPSGVNHWPPLMHAIHKNQAGAAYALIESGADPNATCCRGLTPLMMAAGYGQADIVEGLLARGADPHRRNEAGLSALDVAVTGVTDIDSFTLGRCQTAAVRAILVRAPALARNESAASRAARALKACPEIGDLIERTKLASN